MLHFSIFGKELKKVAVFEHGNNLKEHLDKNLLKEIYDYNLI